MNATSELHDLVYVTAATALMWLPYMSERIVRLGPLGALGTPFQAIRPAALWARRAQAAHTNAVENLVVFAALVLVAAILGISTPATILAAKIYLVARLVHYVVYAAGIPGLRTLAFLTGFGATLAFVWALVQHLA